MDQILIRNLTLSGKHGHYDRELEKGNRFRFQIALELDASRAAETDDLSETVDYEAVIERVKAIVQGPRTRLVERLAGLIAEDLLTGFPRLEAVTVEAMKLDPPVSASVEATGVLIRRARTEGA
jgi:dihydroneopterin aldolase